MKYPREYEPFVKAAVAAGWTLGISGTSHPELTPPPGARDRAGEPAKPFCFPSSPKRNGRTLMNVRARFRQAGIRC